MTDPCTPPPGTKDGSWHWLERQHGSRIGFLWGAGKWDSFKPEFLAALGYRYIGPVDPERIPPDAKDALPYVKAVEQVVKNFGMTDQEAQKPGDLAARTRASLKGE